jgi:hypothetical protein
MLALRSNPDHVRANRLHRLIRLKRNPFFALCWFFVLWTHRATQASSTAVVRFVFIFVLVAAGAIARAVDPNWGSAFSASLLALLLGIALGLRLLGRALLRKIAEVRLSSDF